MSPIHPASLVKSSLHSKAMLELLELHIGENLIEHLAQATVETVALAFGSPSSSKSRGRSASRSNSHASFRKFVSNVVLRSEVTVGVLLVALVYITRSIPYLSIETEDWACERVFLGALILASKYTNDSTLKNIHWALVTSVFGKRDVGRIEREFLGVLDWDLSVTESEILEHHASIMALYPQTAHHHRSSPTTKYARRSPIVQPELWSDSDSDSDDSSTSSTSPSLNTPPTPSHPMSFIQSPKPPHGKHLSQPLYLSHHFSLHTGASTHNTAPLPISLPQIAV